MKIEGRRTSITFAKNFSIFLYQQTDKDEKKEEGDKKEGEKEKEEKADKPPKILNIKEEIKSEVEILDMMELTEEKFKEAKKR